MIYWLLICAGFLLRSSVHGGVWYWQTQHRHTFLKPDQPGFLRLLPVSLPAVHGITVIWFHTPLHPLHICAAPSLPSATYPHYLPTYHLHAAQTVEAWVPGSQRLNITGSYMEACGPFAPTRLSLLWW